MICAGQKPNTAERATDEMHLSFLRCWDAGWSAGEIGWAFGLTRNIPLGVVHRIDRADPEALTRRPSPGDQTS